MIFTRTCINQFHRRFNRVHTRWSAKSHFPYDLQTYCKTNNYRSIVHELFYSFQVVLRCCVIRVHYCALGIAWISTRRHGISIQILLCSRSNTLVRMAVTLHVVQSNIRFVENFTLIFVGTFSGTLSYTRVLNTYTHVYTYNVNYTTNFDRYLKFQQYVGTPKEPT